MRIVIDARRLVKLAGRALLFLFAWSQILFILFLLGNYQQFLDENQRLIMNLLTIALVLHLACGVFYLALQVLVKDPSFKAGRRRLVFVVLSLGLNFIIFLVLEFFYVWISF